MKKYIRHTFYSLVAFMALGGMSILGTACSEDDMSRSVADYDPRYKGTVGFGQADYNVEAETRTVTITFDCDMAWEASIVNSEGEACDWATLSPASGEAGEGQTLTVTLAENEDTENSRTATVTISTEKGATQTFSIAQNYKVIYLDPATIQDYDKYICPASWNPHFENGADYMLRQDSYYSWHRMKQSEHFFVFWSPEFGDDPNSAENQAADMWVDVDDLLQKAEQYFNTNVNKLGMAKLGNGSSMLDDYKMQIYLIYQSEWLATGSGYDDNIGALWVNPSTCHPVGSTIGHEIGHSFQYQVYADKVNKQGYEADAHHGFRYGFGPDGAGGCAFWEQCAQWQSFQDYPAEVFGYDYSVWLKNYHRHFNHEWMRYASYWLQFYWVQKHGVDAFGRIWRESEYPEDPLQTYQRLYCDNDQNTLYKNLYEYASHMVYYDLDGVREYASDDVKGDYATKLYKVGDQQYQVGYQSTPGTTGFNVIELRTPAAGTTVSVKVAAVTPGSALVKGDDGIMVDGDGNKAGTATSYNTNDGNTSSNFRYGYVAIVNGSPVYSDMTSGANGTASYQVPSGTDELYFVIMAAPDTYERHYWNDDESDDLQWPYAITISNTDVVTYEEVVEVNIDPNAKPQNTSLTINVYGDESSSYEHATYKLAYLDNAAICYAFCMTPDQLDAALMDHGTAPEEGRVVIRLKLPDGSYSYDDNCGSPLNGFWCGAEGGQDGWGANGRTYTSFVSAYEVIVGFMPGAITAGETYPQTVELVYTQGGQEYIATLNFRFIVQ